MTMSPEQFKDAQEKLGCQTNAAMARELGVSVSTVEKYRSGSVTIRTPVAKTINMMIAAQEAAKGA